MSDKKAPPSSNPENSGDKKAADRKLPTDVPVVTEKAEPKSNFAKAAQSTGKEGDKAAGKSASGADKKPPRARAGNSSKKSRGWTWFWVLLLVLIAAAVAAWYLFPGVRQQVGQQLQSVPVIGDYFSAGAPVTATRSSQSNAANTTDNTTSGDSESQTDSGAAPQQPPVPEQPMLQPGESRPVAPDSTNAAPSTPSATSPMPPQDQNLRLIGELRQQLSQQNQQLAQQSQTIEQLQQQLAGLQRNVTAQGARLSQLGNASREDWQLAEADYLLRLANQRLMLEQDSRAALGLLKEVDTIIRQVDLPDLYGVRQQLARDITALKLVENVDREGLYLRLRALEEQMVKLNIQPQFDLAKRDATAAQTQADNAEVGEEHFRSSWDNFLNFLKGSVRIRDGEVDPVLLSPQSETRFRQSLRLNMEQAELAVLRADETVFRDAISHARQLLLDFGVDNPQRQVILRELEELSQETIKTELPNLSSSQSALRNYIERMHKVSSGQSDDSDNGGSFQ